MNSREIDELDHHEARLEKSPPGITRLLGDVIAKNEQQSLHIALLNERIEQLTRERDACTCTRLPALLRDQAGAPESLAGCGSITPHGPIIVVQ
jgi:hypothetical protein